jgi:hypothetical protein
MLAPRPLSGALGGRADRITQDDRMTAKALALFDDPAVAAAAAGSGDRVGSWIAAASC